jgi:transposase
LIDGKGRPLRLIITGGQVHDSKVARDLIEYIRSPLALVADKGYDSKAIRQAIADQASLPVIPPRKTNREQIECDAALYAQRNIVERFFCTLKDMRRLATRFEKLARNFLAMAYLCAIRLWID